MLEREIFFGVKSSCWNEKLFWREKFLLERDFFSVRNFCWNEKFLLEREMFFGVRNSCWNKKFLLEQEILVGTRNSCWNEKFLSEQKILVGSPNFFWRKKFLLERKIPIGSRNPKELLLLRGGEKLNTEFSRANSSSELKTKKLHVFSEYQFVGRKPRLFKHKSSHKPKIK